jgi:predicted transcriptional regulator
MPAYREVSQLTLHDLIRPSEDAVRTVRATATLSECAAETSSSPIRAVAVVDDNGNALGVVEEAYIVEAIGRGLGLNKPCTEVMRTDQLVRETVTLEALRTLVAPFQTILVVDESGKPVAHIHRDILAERIRNLA